MITNTSFTDSIIICIVITLMLIVFAIYMTIITIKEHKENKWKDKFKQEFISGYFFAYGNYMANLSKEEQLDEQHKLSNEVNARAYADKWAENDFFESLKEWFPKKYLSEFSKDYFMKNKNSWVEEAMQEVYDVIWWERVEYNGVWAHRKFEEYPNQEYVPIGMI